MERRCPGRALRAVSIGLRMGAEGVDAVVEVGKGGAAAYQRVVDRGSRATACSVVAKLGW